MKVTVVGGSGLVGSMILPFLAEHHQVTVADLQRSDAWDGLFVEADVTHPSTLEGVFDGQDALVFMAMGPMSDWGTPEWARAHFDVSVAGLYATLQAALQQGIARVVLASSASVFHNFEQHPDAEEPDAVEPYGVTKAAGELVARAAARQFEVPVIALRMVRPRERGHFLSADDEHAEFATDAEDTAEAYLAALERDFAPGFHAFTLSGNPRWGVKRQQRLRDGLGWEPKVTRPER